MDFDLKIQEGTMKIFCSKELKEFSKEFMEYYKNHIEEIKKELDIFVPTEFVVALLEDKEQEHDVYEHTGFSGFFSSSGAYAYIDLNGSRSKDYMLKGLMHELTHHLYKYYVYGEEKERITWVDEGLAQLLSDQKEELKNETLYRTFLEENLNIENINLNLLNHEDRSFGNNNGYNLSYIAMRYLNETNSHEEFINLIKDKERLLELGSTIIKDMKEYYDINPKNL